MHNKKYTSRKVKMSYNLKRRGTVFRHFILTVSTMKCDFTNTLFNRIRTHTCSDMDRLTSERATIKSDRHCYKYSLFHLMLSLRKFPNMFNSLTVNNG